MINLKDSIEIKATPEKVFEWLVQRLKDKESYQAWHPDHVDIRWIKGEPLQEGSILYAEEYLHGDLHRLILTEKAAQSELTHQSFIPNLASFTMMTPFQNLDSPNCGPTV